MSLEAKVMEELKIAMKAKDKVALDALKAIKAEILLIKTSGKNSEITEDKEITLLQRLIKQRKEAYDQFKLNHREELAAIEKAQSAIIEKFLPKQLNDEELERALRLIIDETGAKDIKEMGKVMSLASKKLAGQSDGKRISETIKKLLS